MSRDWRCRCSRSGWWKPAYYSKLGWNAYGKGAFTSEGKPSKALSPFNSEATAIATLRTSREAAAVYDLSGRRVKSEGQKGIWIVKGKKMLKQ